jgi:hypothetical protein
MVSPAIRRSADSVGAATAASARRARSEPKPTARSRIRAGSPWTMTSADEPAAAPPKKSPWIGADRRAPPGTLTWKVPRVGEKMPA